MKQATHSTNPDWVSYWAYTGPKSRGIQELLIDTTLDQGIKVVAGWVRSTGRYVAEKIEDKRRIKELVVCRSCVEKGSRSEWCRGGWPESEVACDIDEVLYLNFGNPP